MASNKERKKGTIAVVIVGRVITIERVNRKEAINKWIKNDNFCYGAREVESARTICKSQKNSQKEAMVKKIKEKTDSI